MDYGQNTQSPDPTNMGTDVKGMSSPENKPGLVEDASKWGNVKPDMSESQRNIGNTAMRPQDDASPIESINGASNLPELGKIVDINPMPPTAKQVEQSLNPKILFDEKNIKTEGDRIKPETLKEVNKVEDKLRQDHNLCDFYDAIRDKMLKANLGNSFGREFGGKAA